MSACTIDRHDDLESELLKEKCLRIKIERELRFEISTISRNNNESEARYKASEKFRETARLRCIDLEFVIKTLIDKIRDTQI